MKRIATCIRRRNFLAVSALVTLPPSLAAAASFPPDSRGAQKIGKRVIITQVVFRGKHPVMENPHFRTPTQVTKLVEKVGRLSAASNIKLMALSHALKQPIAASESLLT